MEDADCAYSEVSGLQVILCQLESLSVPSIAILNGTTLGGGLELALACDFRIADSALCQQIGLPEVTIGVLPGAGGCVRLPHLIGLPKAIDLLISGRSITSTRARKLGVVDHLMSSTQSICKSPPSSGQLGGAVYDYQWLDHVLHFLEERKIGNQKVEVEKRGVATAVSMGVGQGGLIDGREVSEEELVLSLAVDWENCEEKVKLKYPKKKKHFLQNMMEYVVHTFLYSIAVFQLWWKVGFRMPAPYACLQTTFRCYYAGSWMEAMSLNSLGLANLIVSPESKGLMGLFLLSRKFKKAAINFGQELKEKSRPFSDHGCSVFVLVSRSLSSYWSAFVQCLLYNGISVNVIIPSKSSRVINAKSVVRRHFDYALKRRRTSKKDVDEAMKLFTCCEADEMESCLKKCGDKRCAMVINMCADVFPEGDAVIKDIEFAFDRVVQIDGLSGAAQQKQVSSYSAYVLMNLGDPLRSNTKVVEVSPATTRTSPEDIRMTAVLAAAMKKTPIVTPPTLSHSVGTHVLVSHWSLAVLLYYFYSGSLSPKIIDRTLQSAGYLRGPFKTMEKMGKFIVPLLTGQSTAHGRLKIFLETRTLPSFRRRKLSAPKGDIVELFNLNLALASLQARQQSQGPFCESALDLLCVGGLVGFPAVEAGPLNYAVRLGWKKLVSMAESYSKRFPFVAETSGINKPLAVLSETNLKELFSETELNLKDLSTNDLTRCLHVQRTDTLLLDQRELQQVPRCQGVANTEVFLLPASVSFTVMIVFVFLVITFGSLLLF